VNQERTGKRKQPQTTESSVPARALACRHWKRLYAPVPDKVTDCKAQTSARARGMRGSNDRFGVKPHQERACGALTELPMPGGRGAGGGAGTHKTTAGPSPVGRCRPPISVRRRYSGSRQRKAPRKGVGGDTNGGRRPPHAVTARRAAHGHRWRTSALPAVSGR